MINKREGVPIIMNKKNNSMLFDLYKLILSVYIFIITLSFSIDLDYNRYDSITIINTIVLIIMFIIILNNVYIASLNLLFKDILNNCIFYFTCLFLSWFFVGYIIDINGISPILAFIMVLLSFNEVKKDINYKNIINEKDDERIKIIIQHYIEENLKIYNYELVDFITENFVSDNKEYLYMLLNHIDNKSINLNRVGFELYFKVYLKSNYKKLKYKNFKNINLRNQINKYLQGRIKSNDVTFDFKSLFNRKETNIYEKELDYIFNYYLSEKNQKYKKIAWGLSTLVIFFIVSSRLALQYDYSWFDDKFARSLYIKDNGIGIFFVFFGKIIKELVRNVNNLHWLGSVIIVASIILYNIKIKFYSGVRRIKNKRNNTKIHKPKAKDKLAQISEEWKNTSI